MRTIKSLTTSIRNHILSAQYARHDFRTEHHIVVFESDDWGSIRMPQRKEWEKLLHLGYAVDKRPYERYDTLESPADMEALFDVLYKHKDANGNYPIITANMLMVNPDFELIEKNGFNVYFYEPVSETYNRYFGNTRVYDFMRQGMKDGVFMPQSHGREHFNVTQWLHGLRAGDEDLLTAFKHGSCGIAPQSLPSKGNQLMNALYAEDDKEQQVIDGIITEGLEMFEVFWGFKSKTFVSPCYYWNEHEERVLADCGVKLIQTDRFSKPLGLTPSRYFYSGQMNDYKQLYSIRNCHFEPSTNAADRDINALMKQVDMAFAHRKIAVFSTHRINYVGGIDEANRSRNLVLLNHFLTTLLNKHPETVFMSSDKLIDIFQ